MEALEATRVKYVMLRSNLSVGGRETDYICATALFFFHLLGLSASSFALFSQQGF